MSQLNSLCRQWSGGATSIKRAGCFKRIFTQVFHGFLCACLLGFLHRLGGFFYWRFFVVNFTQTLFIGLSHSDVTLDARLLYETFFPQE